MHQSLHTHPLHNDIILKLLNTVRGTEVERDEEEEEWEEEAEGSQHSQPRNEAENSSPQELNIKNEVHFVDSETERKDGEIGRVTEREYFTSLYSLPLENKEK